MFTVEMLSETVRSLAELDARTSAPFVLLFEPRSIDHRIVNQFVFFSVESDPTVALDDWVAERPALWFKIVIPAALKWESCDALDQSNITERLLFPGLAGLTT